MSHEKYEKRSGFDAQVNSRRHIECKRRSVRPVRRTNIHTPILKIADRPTGLLNKFIGGIDTIWCCVYRVALMTWTTKNAEWDAFVATVCHSENAIRKNLFAAEHRTVQLDLLQVFDRVAFRLR